MATAATLLSGPTEDENSSAEPTTADNKARPARRGRRPPEGAFGPTAADFPPPPCLFAARAGRVDD